MGEEQSMELTNLVQSSEKAEVAAQETNVTLGDIQRTLEGFTPIVNDMSAIEAHTRDIANDLGEKDGWFHSTLTQILGYYESGEEDNVEAKSLQESMAESLSSILDFNGETSTENKLDKKEKTKKPKMNGQFNDLKDLPFVYGTLGAVIANAINDKNKGEKKGISGFFKGLMEGIGGIASLGVALLAFAGAALIFNFVDWGKAVIGLLAFTVFTIGMVALAKTLSSEQKDLTKFAESSLIMSAALGAFAVSLYIASALMSMKPISIGSISLPAFDVGGAILALVTFGAFEMGMVGIAKLMKNDGDNFAKFALGSLLMTAALVTFSVGLVIASNIFANGINLGPFAKYINGGADNTVLKVDPVGAIAAIGTFLVFELGLAGVARLMGKEVGNFTKFALASIVMSGALVAFSVALVVVSNVLTNGINMDVFGQKVSLPKVDMGAAIAGVATFLVFLISMAVLANVAGSLIGQIALFGAVSILLSVSLVAFSVALIMAGTAVFGGEAVIFGQKTTVPVATGLKAIAAIPIMAVFLAAFAALGIAAAYVGGPAALAAGVLITISLATILMAKAMMLAGLAITGGEAEIEGKKYKLAPYNASAVDKMFDVMGVFIEKFAEVADDIGIKGAIAVAILGKSVIPIVDAMDKMVDVVIKAGENHEAIMNIVSGDGNLLDHLMDPVLYVILGHNLDGNGGLASVADKMGFWGAIVLKQVTKSLVPIVDAMAKMIDVVIKASENYDSIMKVVNGDSNILDHMLDPVLYVIMGSKLDGSGGLSYVADQLGYWGAKTLKRVTEAMGPVVDAMGKMVDVVLKAATLEAEGMTTEELVSLAMYNLNLIMIGNGSITGFIPMFVSTAESLQNTSKKAVNAISAMPPMVEALGALVGVVAEAGELDPQKIEVGIFGLNAMTSFLENFIDTIGRIIPGGVGGFFKKLGSGDPIEKLKEAHDYLQPGGTFYVLFEDLANIAKNFDGKGFENLAKVSVISSFTTGMLESSVNFKDIMSNISTGLKKFTNPAPIDAIANSLQKLTEVQDIGTKFDPIYELVEKQIALHSVASDLEKIASSYEKIGAADKLGRLNTDFSGNLQDQSVAEQKGSTEGEQNVQPVKKGEELAVIANILNEWHAKGVRVYGIDTGDKKKAVKTINI